MIPELFYIVSSHLSDKEKISLASCSKIFYNYKSLLKFDSIYDLSQIYNEWCMANIRYIYVDKFIESDPFEKKFREIIKNNESIILKKNLIKLTSLKTKITLQINKDLIKKLILLECDHIALIILLKNNNSIENMINVLIKSIRRGYTGIVKLLIDKDDIKNECNSIIKILIDLAILNEHTEIKKLLEDKFSQILIKNPLKSRFYNEYFKNSNVKIQYCQSKNVFIINKNLQPSSNVMMLGDITKN